MDNYYKITGSKRNLGGSTKRMKYFLHYLTKIQFDARVRASTLNNRSLEVLGSSAVCGIITTSQEFKCSVQYYRIGKA